MIHEPDYQDFYKKLFVDIETEYGPIDPASLVAIICFDMGGPLNFSTINSSCCKFAPSGDVDYVNQ